MDGKLRVFLTAGILGLVLVAGLMGLFRPLDNALRDLRFAAETRAPSGEFLFVDIDSQSIAAVGVWPWPRGLHARVIDTLMDAGANEVAFDVDFSTPSSDTEDAILEAALERAGGYVHLAAFRQLRNAAGDELFNLPLPRFAEFAEPVTVNVAVDGGVVREYPFAMTLGETVYPSLAAALTAVDGPADQSFTIDYSVDPQAIDRVPVAQVLDGTLDPARVAGRNVVIGASALELRDTFVVPRFGVIPGAMVQILAAETLRPGNLLTHLGWAPTTLAVVLIALGYLLLGRNLPLAGAMVGGLALLGAVEGAAVLLQTGAGVLVDTAAVDVTVALLLLEALLWEVQVRRHAHVEAARQRDAMRSVLDRVIADNFDGIVVIDAGGRIIAASGLAEQMLGGGLMQRRAGEVLPRDLRLAVEVALSQSDAGGGTVPAETELSGKSGEPRTIEYTITRSEIAAAGTATQRVACLTFRDITDRRRSEEQLRYVASHDTLTGALSRRELAQLIHAHFESERGREAGAVLAIFDLSRFATVNETLGHQYGDEVLKQVAARLGAASADAVARVGGDSFAVLLRRAMSTEEVIEYCSLVVERIALPYGLSGGREALISAVAGATDAALSGFDPDMMFSHADMAVSEAKLLPGRGVMLFTPAMDARLKEKQDMDAALRLALIRNELSLAFQTQIELATEKVVGVEALVRWRHPDLGGVSPALFIPIAEETGQIIEIGRWIMREACREVASWPGDLRLAVNVSPIQFEMSDVVSDVEDALRSSGLPANRLDVEITEGIFVSKGAGIIASLERLRALGVGIALDDFGTGYSSLSYLGRLPIDKIKIDQSFVKGLPGDTEAGAIIQAVMTISQTLRKVVVAEGVETADQAWMLKMIGCDIGQGYLFSRPRSGAEVRAELEGMAARPAVQAF